jgi:hypothetical protein
MNLPCLVATYACKVGYTMDAHAREEAGEGRDVPWYAPPAREDCVTRRAAVATGAASSKLNRRRRRAKGMDGWRLLQAESMWLQQQRKGSETRPWDSLPCRGDRMRHAATSIGTNMEGDAADRDTYLTYVRVGPRGHVRHRGVYFFIQRRQKVPSAT